MSENNQKNSKPSLGVISEGKSSSNLDGGTFFKIIFLTMLGIAGQFIANLGWWIWVPIGLLLVFTILKAIIPPQAYALVKSIFVWAALGIIILYVIYFGKAAYQSGIWKGGATALEDSGVDKAVKSTGGGLMDYIRNPQKLFYEYYSWDSPKSTEKKELKGIEFFGVETRRDEFKEGMNIVVTGTAKVSAMKDKDTSVTFNCGFDENNISEKIKNENYNSKGVLKLRGIEGNSITVYAGRNEVVDFVCELNGIDLDLGDSGITDEDKRKDEIEDIRTFVVSIEGIYSDFVTTSLLKVYNLQREKLNQLRDPFENIKEPLLDSNFKMRSQCLSGCGLTRLALKTSKQPQTEIGSYTFSMSLRKDSDWYGDIKKVKSLEVMTPQNFELIACENFGGDAIFDDGDAPYFEILNEKIKDDYGTASDYAFYCDYRISRPRIFIGFDEFMAKATYDYLVTTKKTINIIETRDLQGMNNIAQGDETIPEEGYDGADYYET